MSENMAHEINECDQLRSPERVVEPDSRTHNFVILEDKETGKFRDRVVADQYEAVAGFRLNEVVPERIAIHFETAKNLYLYAWFVYRFYPMAEQQAIASLEFSLRERLVDFVVEYRNKHPRKIEPGLKKLLDHAIKNGFIRNEDFSAREHWAKIRAKLRYSHQKRQEASDASQDRWVEDESEIVVTQEDLNYDWLGDFLELIPRVRNLYAHGSWHLYPAPVLHTFEMVTEIINQLYSSNTGQ